MTDERTLQPKCPKCHSLKVQSAGCAMTVAPCERSPDPYPFDFQPRPRKVVEYKYRCLDCSEAFSITEEC
jgi:hypothetical protein